MSFHRRRQSGDYFLADGKYLQTLASLADPCRPDCVSLSTEWVIWPSEPARFAGGSTEVVSTLARPK